MLTSSMWNYLNPGTYSPVFNMHFILVHLLTSGLRYGGLKCVRFSNPSHCFSFLQVRLFWKAPTGSSHENFILGHLLTLGLPSGGLKSALLSAPSTGQLFRFLANNAFLQSPD